MILFGLNLLKHVLVEFTELPDLFLKNDNFNKYL